MSAAGPSGPGPNSEPDPDNLAGDHNGGHRPWLEQDRRPPGVSDQLVEATGKLSEAVEWVERARGALYEFHQLSGHADLLLGEAADLLEAAQEPDRAQWLRRELVGRNVVQGRWTFQIVEEYDATYWQPVRDARRTLEAELLNGRAHVYESEMKEARRTRGHPHHTARPKPSE